MLPLSSLSSLNQKKSKIMFSGYQPSGDEMKPGADFHSKDLEDVTIWNDKDLSGANFSSARLINGKLQGNHYHNTNFRSAHLDNALMFNIKASNADFSWAKTEGNNRVNFKDSFLDNTFFVNANLKSALFNSASLKGASLNSGTFDNANFQNAQATDASFNNIDAHSADFSDTILDRSQFIDSRLNSSNFLGAHINNTKFNNAKLTNATLNNIKGKGGDFRQAILENATIEHAILDNANFYRATLRNARFFGTSLANANFQRTNLKNTQLNNVYAPNIDFSLAVEGDEILLNSSNFNGGRFYAAHFPKAKLASSQLNGAFMQGVNLNGANLSQVQAQEADFKGAKLDRAKLCASELSRSNFIGADLENSDFTAANLTHAKLAAALLGHSDFKNARLNNADISSTGMDRANFMNSQAQNANFCNSKGLSPIFADADLKGASFIDAKYISPDFLGAHMNQSFFSGVEFHNPEFHNVKASQADFRRAVLTNGDLTHADFQKANFERANLASSRLESSRLNHANLSGATLTDTDLKYTLLSHASLTNADLTKADLTGSQLDEANLAEAKLRQSNLSGADLSKARNIKLADFEGSFYKDGFKPKLPDGITPEHLGIRKVKDITPGNAHAPQGRFFSFYTSKQFEKLAKSGNNPGAKAEYTFFKYLAENKNSPDWTKEFINEGERIDNALQSLREKYKGQNVSDSYTPEARNGKNEADEETSLHLEDFRLNRENSFPYPDLNTFKEACLAQQLYSQYLTHANGTLPRHFSSTSSWASGFSAISEEKKAAFWLNRLKNTFEEDYTAETGQQPDPAPFISWLTQKYNLYNEPTFDLNRSLEAAYTDSEEDEAAGLANILGYSNVKDKLKEQILAPLTFPMISKAGPAKPQKGWIFHGEPGTGKSHLAKAVANQLGLKPVEVSLSAIGSSYENQTVRNLTVQFEKAKRLAQRHGASVVLLDEMNQVGDNRQKGGNSKSDLTNALLNMITKYVEQAKENIICVGTTNDLKAVDPALKRAGRLGAHEEIEAPDFESRTAYLQKQLPQGDHFLKPLDLYEGSRNGMIDYIANKTEGKPTSALKLLVDRLTGGYQDKVTRRDVDNALEQIKLDLRKQL